MFKDQEQLLRTLQERNLLTSQQVQAVRTKVQAGNAQVEDLLLADRLVDERALTKVKSDLLNIPLADLQGVRVDGEILNAIPEEVAENYQMIAFDLKDGHELQVGMVNPQDFKAIEAVEFLAQKSDYKVRYFIISSDDFHAIARQYKVLGQEAEEALARLGETSLENTGGMNLGEEKMEDVVKSAPVSKMVLVIIRHAIDGHASDIHVEPSIKETRVRYRIDGVLRTSLVLPKYIHPAIVSRIKVLANLKLDETRRPQDGRMRLSIEGREIDFRISTLPLVEGEKVVMRVLDTTAKVPDLTELGFNTFSIEHISEAIKRPYGLVLLTGPTGSGKTTTLYTILSMLNQEGANIETLEDPIEYYIDGINQSQINTEIGYSFANGLRSILRQDPNIIMVGEIRDPETTELVIHASLTGHMVLSTLHTNDAVSAFPRLVDLGGEPFLLSSVVNLVIAQRLARKICEDCKVETGVPESMRKRVSDQLKNLPAKYLSGVDVANLKFWKGEGCAHCGNLGYKGRVAVAEVITVTPKIRELVYEQARSTDVLKELANQEFITLVQDSLLKALQGVITLEEVSRVSQI